MEEEMKTAKAQALHWNGDGGRGWFEARDVLNRMFQPLEIMLTDMAQEVSAKRVLDVGCGAGSTTRALARRLGPHAQCVGIDISEQLIAAARLEAEPSRNTALFFLGDAETYAFGCSGYDLIVSRFGVMFFADPIKAFSNLRRSGRSGAMLSFFAWRSSNENPFMTVPEYAAASFIPSLPPRQLHSPGQFAFCDRQHIQEILDSSGWSDVSVQPVNVSCSLPVSELQAYFTLLGPVAPHLRKLDVPLRDAVIAKIWTAFTPYIFGDEVRFNAACWLVKAHSEGMPLSGMSQS